MWSPFALAPCVVDGIETESGDILDIMEANQRRLSNNRAVSV